MKRKDLKSYPTLSGRLFEGVVTGLIVGLSDAILLQLNVAQSRGIASFLPPSIWFTVPLTWTTLCVLAALVCTIPSLPRFWTAILTFTGPGLLVLSRVGTLLFRQYRIRPTTLLLGWFLITTAAAVLASHIVRSVAHKRLGLTRHRVIAYAFAAILVIGAGATFGSSGPRARIVEPRSSRPNIILIFLDTVSYDDAVSSMPNLRMFASQAITFDNAWAPAPWTLPSHVAVLTGEDPWRLDFDDRSYSLRFSSPTLAERLSAAGYATAAIYANPVLNPDTGLMRGVGHVEGFDYSGISRSGVGFLLSRLHFHGGPRIPWFAWMSAEEVTRQAIRFVSTADRPYFLTLNFMDAHYPYYVPGKCRGKDFESFTAEDRLAFLKGVDGGFSRPEVAARMRRQYRAAMNCLDMSLGVLLHNIEVQTGSQKTVIAIVSDHGEQFGEHGLTEHGNSLYRQVLHVPLILKLPESTPRLISDPVNITDLYGTLLQVANVRGSSHTTPPLLDPRLRRPVISSPATSGHVEEFSIVSSSVHLIQNQGGAEEMYDYRNDPQEQRSMDTARVPSSVQTARSMLIRGRQLSKSAGIPFRALGYFQ